MNIKQKIILLFVIFAAVFISGCSKNDFDAEEIEFNGQEIKVQKNNTTEIIDNNVIITNGGRYLFTGSGENVQVKIDTRELVEVYFENLNISNNELVFLNIKSSGTVNIFSYGENNNEITVSGDEKDECIKSKGKIAFSGTTPIIMDGYHCIKADNADISSNLNLISEGDAIKADTINIIDGNINITSNSDCIDADKVKIYSGEVILTGQNDDARGIYTDDLLEISGGTILIDTKDDGISSNKDIIISGGEINIMSGDDAIHSDELIQIENGNITITECLEGMESGVICINDGSINIKSRNDGLNAAQSDKDNRKSANITINGGVIKINAEGDGLDANGSIYINDGILYVSGSADDKNNAIDYDADFVINGGIIVAAGNSKKAKLPYDRGIQSAVFIRFENMQTTDENLIIYDENDNVILLADFPKAYNCIIFSSSILINNKKYYIGSLKTKKIENDYVIQPDVNPSNIIFRGEFVIKNSIVWSDISN